jgi:hypothetical protein
MENNSPQLSDGSDGPAAVHRVQIVEFENSLEIGLYHNSQMIQGAHPDTIEGAFDILDNFARHIASVLEVEVEYVSFTAPEDFDWYQIDALVETYNSQAES